MRVVDFRSDTVTHPTPEMREAMAAAEVGDDVFGDDPTVNRLEELAAEMFGKEAAVFVSSGTMGNLVAVLAQCQRGEEVIVGDKSHIYRAEAASVSVLGGVAVQVLPNDSGGMFDTDALEAAIHPEDSHYARTRLVAMENTHNACSGAALTPEDMKTVGDVARANDLRLHLDGARIFNASVYLETPVAELARDADTVTFCLSKGLSAPVGSVVCGSHEAIDEARRWRKAVGGGMRQAGVIAAAGIVALQTMIDRLAEDHANARRLAQGLAGIPGIEIDPESVQTNLVFFDVIAGSHLELARRLKQRGIDIQPRSARWRLATHYGIVPDDIDYALEVIESVFGSSDGLASGT